MNLEYCWYELGSSMDDILRSHCGHHEILIPADKKMYKIILVYFNPIHLSLSHTHTQTIFPPALELFPHCLSCSS